MIVKEAQREFRLMRETEFRPPFVVRPNTPVSEIIKQTEPPELVDDRTDIVAWFAQWLCRWSLFAFPDDAVRDAALEMARQQQLST